MFRYTMMVKCADGIVRRIGFQSIKTAIHFARNDMWRGQEWRIVDNERMVSLVDHAPEPAYQVII